MFEEHMKKLEENRESFRKIKEANKEDTREYLSKQENLLSALFSMVIDDIFYSDKEELVEKTESLNLPNMEDYSDELKASDILKSELDSWELKDTYLGYRYLLAVEQIAYKYTGCITDDEYDAICDDIADIFNKSSKDIKGAITFIRKKANFNNAKYLSVLSKMPKSKITNQFILNQFIELCS